MTLPIVIAVTGCIALLVGLYGGGIKVKEIEIPRISSLPRTLSSVVGILFIGIAMLLSLYPNAFSNAPASPLTGEPASKSVVEPASTADKIPFVKDPDSLFAGLTVTEVSAQLIGADVEFRFDYTSDSSRWILLFDPPNGNTISIRKSFPAGTNYVLLAVDANDLQKVSNITVSFYLPNQQRADYISLDFQRIKAILP